MNMLCEKGSCLLTNKKHQRKHKLFIGSGSFYSENKIVFGIKDDFTLKTKMGCQGCFLFGKRQES